MELVYQMLSGVAIAIAVLFGLALAMVIAADGVRIGRRDARLVELAQDIETLKQAKHEWYERARRAEAELVKRGVTLTPVLMSQPMYSGQRAWADHKGG